MSDAPSRGDLDPNLLMPLEEVTATRSVDSGMCVELLSGHNIALVNYQSSRTSATSNTTAASSGNRLPR
jgi:hypothetical protein